MSQQVAAVSKRTRSARDDYRQITEFCQSIVDISDAATSREAILRSARVALPPSAFLLLRYLDIAGSLSVSQLAEVVGLHPSTVSSQLRPLTDKRFVRRAVGSDDGRVVSLSITAAGRAACERVREVGAREWGFVLADWSAADRSQLAELMQRAEAAVRRRAASGKALA
jgi:DNA-binding MarR family transcriptional regulator